MNAPTYKLLFHIYPWWLIEWLKISDNKIRNQSLIPGVPIKAFLKYTSFALYTISFHILIQSSMYRISGIPCWSAWNLKTLFSTIESICICITMIAVAYHYRLKILHYLMHIPFLWTHVLPLLPNHFVLMTREFKVGLQYYKLPNVKYSQCSDRASDTYPMSEYVERSPERHFCIAIYLQECGRIIGTRLHGVNSRTRAPPPPPTVILTCLDITVKSVKWDLKHRLKN